jgi:hypothetical protein
LLNNMPPVLGADLRCANRHPELLPKKNITHKEMLGELLTYVC